MECLVCNDNPGEKTVLALERRDGTVTELDIALCAECEAGLCADDWIEAVGAPAEA